jgi:hypothetical protein
MLDFLKMGIQALGDSWVLRIVDEVPKVDFDII